MYEVETPAQEAAGRERARRVLIVDDENGVRDLMTRWLEAGGYTVTTASSAEEALGHLDTAPSAVALCDIRMPGHDGLWLADRIRQRHPETAVIMATGVHDVVPDEHLGDGVIDYLTKPFGRDRLREAVQRGLEWHRSAWDARRWRQTLEEEIQLRRSRLTEAIMALHIDSPEAVGATLSMLMLSDRDAFAHAYRVADLAVDIGRALGRPNEELSVIHLGGLLHDLGKLAMPEAILRKPAPLTAEEFSLIRTHPAIGSEIIADVPYLAAAAPIVRDVHERVDGLGYPRGVNDAEITFGARLVAVAEAYDTMIRPRVFRDAMPPSEALLELERCTGTQFDAAVVTAFRQLVDR
jgi:response regulator RpfG family c-di-GMP phosphodiesterase